MQHESATAKVTAVIEPFVKTVSREVCLPIEQKISQITTVCPELYLSTCPIAQDDQLSRDLVN